MKQTSTTETGEVTKDAQRFQITIITGLMLLGNMHLLCWDYDKLKRLV